MTLQRAILTLYYFIFQYRCYIVTCFISVLWASLFPSKGLLNLICGVIRNVSYFTVAYFWKQIWAIKEMFYTPKISLTVFCEGLFLERILSILFLAFTDSRGVTLIVCCIQQNSCVVTRESFKHLKAKSNRVPGIFKQHHLGDSFFKGCHAARIFNHMSFSRSWNTVHTASPLQARAVSEAKPVLLKSPKEVNQVITDNLELQNRFYSSSSIIVGIIFCNHMRHFIEK